MDYSTHNSQSIILTVIPKSGSILSPGLANMLQYTVHSMNRVRDMEKTSKMLRRIVRGTLVNLKSHKSSNYALMNYGMILLEMLFQFLLPMQ